MRCANSTTCITIKVFVEKNVIAEIGIVIHFTIESVAGPFTLFVADENVRETLMLQKFRK